MGIDHGLGSGGGANGSSGWSAEGEGVGAETYTIAQT